MSFPSGIDDTHCSERNTKQGNSTAKIGELSNTNGHWKRWEDDARRFGPHRPRDRTVRARRLFQSPGSKFRISHRDADSAGTRLDSCISQTDSAEAPGWSVLKVYPVMRRNFVRSAVL